VLLPVEREEDEAEHIKRGEQRGEQANGVKRMATWNLERRAEDGVFGEEARERREARDGQRGDEHGPVSDFDFLAEAAHVVHVLLATHSVDDGAGREEEKRFEERVGHQVEDASAECTDSAAEEHITELRNGGVREDSLDVRLNEADGGGEESRGAADDS